MLLQFKFYINNKILVNLYLINEIGKIYLCKLLYYFITSINTK